MATLLTNRKMDPALAARIEASLRRRGQTPGAEIYRPRVIAVGRALAVVAAIATVIAIVVTQRRARVRFETRKKALRDAVIAQSAPVTENDREMVRRTETILRQLTAPYDADLVAPELRASGVVPLLSKGTVYVRGALGDFIGGRSIASVTQDSTKDTFVYCLFDPPAARDEKTLVAKVREAWSADAIERRTPDVVLLRDAELGLPFLGPSWLVRVQSTESALDLGQLEQAFAHAPIDRAKKAFRSPYLLAVLDEGSMEPSLEGDHAHDVRVAIVDLASARPLLRVRRRVDPSVLSAGLRAKYSFDVDACALALDVRAEVSP